MYLHIKKSKYLKFFWSLMAFYMLNICVDAPDIVSDAVPENLNFNDQESIIEIFVEKILGYEHAIPEYEESDSEKQSMLKQHKTIDHFIINLCETENLFSFRSIKKPKNSFYLDHLYLIYQEVDFPPPEV
ncbi:hypothetical protein [Aquimarina algicola]|uniref:Uncharacterized protein n=1 Tax=Aquimarina algicola TaxID=2589995 RepID=A0A504JB00_9FLAO|nr:hypothetical protein [Aquimarina algicola]TPN84713.1 hypothetical protein FHK87_17450 [Aquimarina algicola]